MKRLMDVSVSLVAIVIWLVPGLLIALLVMTDGHGPFFVQQRVGRYGRSFGLIKFRTMRQGAASAGQLTIGMKDRRITRVGGFLRKYKLDELPQLINVLVGQMSLVGPRPEVKKYVDLYTAEQRRVLEVRPGLTDYASLYYIRENELLGAAPDPEYTYIHEVMPDKLRLALKYMDEQGVATDLKIMWLTIRKILTGR
ncbi:MAG: sugar transferase [Flavobacteriales bacterium]|nr:sugar transferase [Flavobacteriales bacterium]